MQKVVETNSVIISAAEYEEILLGVVNAMNVMKAAKDASIFAWRNDIASRSAELEKIILIAFITDHVNYYSDLLSDIVNQKPLKWYQRLRGKKPLVDGFGSLENFAAAAHGKDLRAFRAQLLSEVDAPENDPVAVMIELGSYNSNVKDVLYNRWDYRLECMKGVLNSITTANGVVVEPPLQAQFVIPRSVFDEYTRCILDAANGKFDTMCELHINRSSRLEPDYYTPKGYKG